MIRGNLVIFSMILAMGAVAMPHGAQAGFEFHPPKQNPAPVAPTSQISAWEAPPPVAPPALPTPAPIMTPPVNYQPVAVPPPPVMQMPAAEPVTPVPYTNVNVAPVVPPIKAATSQPAHVRSGLVIDPYPLRNQKTNHLTPSHQAVATTMAESAGVITPVQLGAGMNTGVQPYQLDNNPNSAQYERRAPQPITPTSLTPIPGGEPAPLPNVDVGMEQAYYDPSYTQAPSVVYANAVGFARDVPMAIALEQIIPEGFSPRFVGPAGKDNALVSWEGGEPWNIVLNNMLRPHNLTAVITGQTVTIQPMASL